MNTSKDREICFFDIKLYVASFLLLIISLFMLTGCPSTSSSGVSDGTPVVLVAGLSGLTAGDLYILDSESGEVLGFVDTGADCGTPCEIGSIRSSVYEPVSETLIVGTSGSNFCSACIVQIDLSTRTGTILWNNAAIQNVVDVDFLVNAVAGMSMNFDGTIYAVVKQGEGGPVGLISFTTSTPPVYIGLTGVAASVLRLYDLGNGIAFWPDGTLYYTTGAGLSTINIATAVATNLGDLIYDGLVVSGDPDFTKVGGMTLTPSGKLVGILDDSNTGRYFGTLDPATRTFATTAFYAGASIESIYGLNKISGLGVIPERLITANLLPLP